MSVKFKAFIQWFSTSKEGRTIQRFTKTFIYASISTYITTRFAPFQADWLFILETGLLAGFGFAIDKGYRESINKEVIK